MTGGGQGILGRPHNQTTKTMNIREFKAVEWISDTPPPEKGVSYSNRIYKFAPVRFWGWRRIEFPEHGSADLMVRAISGGKTRVINMLDQSVQEGLFIDTLISEREFVEKVITQPTPTPTVEDQPPVSPDSGQTTTPEAPETKEHAQIPEEPEPVKIPEEPEIRKPKARR